MFEIEIPLLRFHTHQSSIRMRGRAGTGAYMSGKGRGYKGLIERDVRNAMQEQGAEAPLFPAGEPVCLRVVFCYPGLRKQQSRLAWRAKRPDMDNMLKLVKDALQGLLFADDAQLARIVMEKQHVAEYEQPALKILAYQLSDPPQAW